jgi:hypothetical protein
MLKNPDPDYLNNGNSKNQKRIIGYFHICQKDHLK